MQKKKEKKWQRWFGLNHITGKGHECHARLRNMTKECIYIPNLKSSATTLAEADGRRRNKKSSREAAGRSGPAENGLPACEISLPAVSHSSYAEESINISLYFSAPGLNLVSAENRDIHYGFCQIIKNMFLDAFAVIIGTARGWEQRAAFLLFGKKKKRI